MAFGFSRSRLAPIAIDAGADQLKLLQVAPGEPAQLAAMAAEPVPEEARGDAENRLAFIEEALPRLLQQGQFRGRRAMCAIPAFNTYVHHLDIAANQKVSREDQLQSQLRERLGLEPTRMVVRSFDVANVQQEAGQFTRVIALAAKRDKVMKYVDLARRCRLEVVGMHSEPLCVVRAFAHLFRRETDAERACCFVDLGASTTKVTIAHGQQMVFTKTIQAGGEQALKALAKARSVGLGRARELHLAETGPIEPERLTADMPSNGAATGSAATNGEGTDGDGAMLAEDAAPVATMPGLDASSTGDEAEGEDDEALETILDELRLCVRYHGQLFPDRPVEQVVFLGGEAHRTDRCRRIAQALHLPATIGDPLGPWQADPRAAIVGVDPSTPQPGWAVPVGLSQSEANL